jgi:hypothetical protein
MAKWVFGKSQNFERLLGLKTYSVKSKGALPSFSLKIIEMALPFEESPFLLRLVGHLKEG